MPKRNIPNYRLHKATGQAFVELGGRRIYLGKHGSKASREEYEWRIGEYLANGRQLQPTQPKTGTSCQELAIRFCEWAEEYFMSQPKSFNHVKMAMGFLVKHYGRESTDNFAPMSLVFLQKQLVEHGYARLMVNRYVAIVKQAFKHGAKFGWVNPQTSYALQVVDNLKKGRTKAHEYRDVKPVDPDDIEKTLAELPKRIADMARIQRLCVMRPQDVCNLCGWWTLTGAVMFGCTVLTVSSRFAVHAEFEKSGFVVGQVLRPRDSADSNRHLVFPVSA
jgi:hypothetical protein